MRIKHVDGQTAAQSPATNEDVFMTSQAFCVTIESG
jgi:hypothetical protein